MTDIGAKIGIDGEKQFRKELQEITQTGKTLSAQMDTLTSAFDKNEASEEDLAKVTKKLDEQIENQKKLVDKLKEAVQKSTEKTGENSVETQKWKEKLAKAEKGLNDLEKESKEAAGGVKELSGAESDASEKTGIFGDVLKGNLASEAIQKGISLTVELIKDAAKFLVEAVKGAAEYADEVSTLADTTGMSTDAIQEYKYAAELLDVEFSTIEGSLTKLTKKMSDARDGSATASEAFEKLGIRVTNADGSLRNANDVFNEAIDVLGKIPNETERDAVAMDLFGKSAKDLNPLIEAGSRHLNSLRQEAHDVGAVMDGETLNSLNDVNDGFYRLSAGWDTLKKTLGAKLGAKILPDLEKLVSLFQNLLKTNDFQEFSKEIEKFADNLLKKRIPNLVKRINKELPKIMRSIGKAIEKLLPSLAESIGKTLGSLLANLPELVKAGANLVGGLIKGVVNFIPNLVKGIVNGFENPEIEKEVDELGERLKSEIQEVKDYLDEIPRATDRVASSMEDVNAKRAEAEKWIDVFENLYHVADPTAAQTERLKLAVDKLNELYPTLGLAIDEDTGKWNMNAAAIRDTIDAISTRAAAEAYFSAASETLEDIAKLELERDKQESAFKKAKDATDEQRKQIQKVTEAWEHSGAGIGKTLKDLGITSQEAFDRWLNGANDTLNELTDIQVAEYYKWREYQDTLQEQREDAEKLFERGQAEMDAYVRGLAQAEQSRTEAKVAESWYGDMRKKIEAIQKVMRGEAKSLGELLDKGMAEGIAENEDLVTTAAGNMVQRAVKRMKTVAQIKSPSRLTKNLIGKNLALGVVEGWKSVMTGHEFKNTFSLSGVMRSLQSDIRPVTNNETTNVGGITVNVANAQNINENRLADIIMLKMQAQVNRRRNVFSNVLHVQ